MANHWDDCDGRKGLYRVTFDWPEKRDAGGATLDIAHGAGHHDYANAPIVGIDQPYVGPLCPHEVEFLKNVRDRPPAYTMTTYVPESWRVTVDEVDLGSITTKVATK